MTHEAQKRGPSWQPNAGQTVENVVLMDTEKLRPCKLNPRREFGNLQALAESIKRNKVIDPLIVRLLPEGPEVICGERRRRAAVLANVPMVAVIIRDLNDQQVIELCLIEAIESKELTDLEKGLACIELKTRYKDNYPNNDALAQRLGVSRQTVERWIRVASDLPEEIKKLLCKSAVKSGTPLPKGTISSDIALSIKRRINESGRQVTLAKALAELGVPVPIARDIVKEVAAYPGEPIERIIRRQLDAAPRLSFTPVEAEIIRLGGKTQTTITHKADRIEVGTRVEGMTRFVDFKVVSVERKALRDFTEEDAKAEGGYSLEHFKDNWKQLHHGVLNPKQQVYVIGFSEIKPVSLGMHIEPQPSTPSLTNSKLTGSNEA